MDIHLIKNAILKSISLLNQEMESVEVEMLKDEYLEVIQNLEIALKEIENNEQMES